jgi:hypothetical protein
VHLPSRRSSSRLQRRRHCRWRPASEGHHLLRSLRIFLYVMCIEIILTIVLRERHDAVLYSSLASACTTSTFSKALCRDLCGFAPHLDVRYTCIDCYYRYLGKRTTTGYCRPFVSRVQIRWALYTKQQILICIQVLATSTETKHGCFHCTLCEIEYELNKSANVKVIGDTPMLTSTI